MTQCLARYAARRAHVLTVEVPGYWLVRATAERRLRARGWCVSTSPGDADVLAVCGAPGPELTSAVDRVWDQLPGPRVLIELADPNLVESALDRAFVELIDTDKHRSDAGNRAHTPTLSGDDSHSHRRDRHAMDRDAMEGSTVNDGGDGHVDHGDSNHDDMEHDSTSDGGHGHMDHGDMDMAPAGIALAEGGEDRDGLEMDVLQVRLGPVLRNWPAGLVLRCALQGDVLTEADARVVDRDFAYSDAPLHRRNERMLAAARHCDHASDLLMLAGWPRGAAAAAIACDALVSEPTVDRGQSLIERLYRTLCRSRMLRWSLRDIASLTVEDCDRLELPVAMAGDCFDRLLTHVDTARRTLSETLQDNNAHAPSSKVVNALPEIVTGLDLATTRLAIASLGIETAPEPAGGRDG